MLPQNGNRRVEFFLRDGSGAAEDDGRGRFDLVGVEFAEIFHIDLALVGVRHGDETAKLQVRRLHALHGSYHVAELADAGGLDQNTVRVILLQNLDHGPAEIAHQRATDAAGVHLVDLDARLLHKAAVDADLAEFVLNEDDLFSGIGFPDHLLYQGRLARPQKTGVNVDDCHIIMLPFKPFDQLCNVSIYYTTICTVPQAIPGKR